MKGKGNLALMILEKAKKTYLPEDLNISITNDESVRTENAVNDLVNNIIFGVLLVVGVLMFFLGIRNALLVGLAIPLSMLMSFIVLKFMGITLNTMVLFALVMGLGMLVEPWSQRHWSRLEHHLTMA